MNIIAIVQARMSSTRLPGKVMRLVNLDTPLIDILLYRLSQSKNINKIVLATSTNSADKVLVDHVSKLGFDVFTGSENDVLDRYYCAAKKYSADIVVRITGDCPLVDPNLVDSIIDMYKSISVDYVSNTITPTYPDGLDVEVFSFLSLESAWNVATSKSDREHVTPYIKKSGKYTTENFYNDKDYTFERWTVDEMDDYEVIRSIFSIMNPCVDFSWKEVLSLKSKHKSIFSKNKDLC